jgi:hypothetical protein
MTTSSTTGFEEGNENLVFLGGWIILGFLILLFILVPLWFIFFIPGGLVGGLSGSRNTVPLEYNIKKE